MTHVQPSFGLALLVALAACSANTGGAPHDPPMMSPECASTDCPEPADCVDDTCMTPDLQINRDVAARSLSLVHRVFAEDSCELEEMCVSGSGRRRLLQFEGRVENLGPGDLDLGTGEDDPRFEHSVCHDHQHFIAFTDYRLLGADGSVVVSGHKQSFCLVDMEPAGATSPAAVGTHPEPGLGDCGRLSAGWADIYAVGTPCQWIDVTDVPEGDYVLSLSVNPRGTVAETVTDNNTVLIPVHLHGDVPCEPVLEVCGDDVDQDCDELTDDADPDCESGCPASDPSCGEVVPVEGNDSCATAHAMDRPAVYQTQLATGDTSDIAPPCGVAGGEAFFRFTLEREQLVYLGALGSDMDTVLALYQGDCGGAPLRCEDDACGGDDGHFVDVLAAGSYLVAVKAKHPSDFGRVRLKFQHADRSSATVIEGPGIYAGDTSAATDDVTACVELDGGEVDADPGAVRGESPDDVYAVAACDSTLIASTCGTSAFRSLIEVRAGSLDQPARACGASGETCAGEALGATAEVSVSNGLSFIIVDGVNAADRGSYRLFVSY